ncbi:uncharacterized protein V6R79_020679 [Siganus canaliculatus]
MKSCSSTGGSFLLEPEQRREEEEEQEEEEEEEEQEEGGGGTVGGERCRNVQQGPGVWFSEAGGRDSAGKWKRSEKELRLDRGPWSLEDPSAGGQEVRPTSSGLIGRV